VGRFFIRQDADADLDEQADYYTRAENVELGLRFLEAAHETFRSLADRPAIGRARKFRNAKLSGARWHPIRHFGDHLVFYRPSPEGIEVLRVVHGKRDLSRTLERY
jgi:toxin ParE1/3/4